MLRVKNWAEFQHYKDRSPPWIKLHKALLDDREFQRLPDASRALAPCLWLLASEAKDGIFNGSVEEVSFRVRQTEKWVSSAIKPLISGGFLIVVQVASNPLAECGQVAVPEGEAEAETETTLSGKPDSQKLNGKDPTLHANAVEILGVLNATAGKNYQPVKANLEMIEARLKDGATPDEMKSVIGKKCAQWLSDEKMCEFLRPKTLFNRTNFANYQGELGSGGDWRQGMI